ncbi:hypothetical protein QQG55_34800 [Brugia pahangi]
MALPTLQQLPIILLSKIASNLNIYEQKNFSDTCRAARSPICTLHLWDLQDIELFTRKSAKQIYGALRHLDLRGCSVEYNELKYFSNACSKLSSIAITHAATILPNELFENEDCMKQNALGQHPFEKMHEFLRLSLPKFTEMEKSGELPVEHIELITKLLILFPYLETFQID